MNEAAQALVDRISQTFHVAHRQDLARMHSLARRLNLDGLADEIDELHALLEDHMLKEEEQLFPMMTSSGVPAFLPQVIDDLRAEHRQIDAMSRSVAASVIMLAPVLDSARQHHAVEFLATSRRFFSQLAEHAALEDEALFPLFKPPRRSGAAR